MVPFALRKTIGAFVTLHTVQTGIEPITSWKLHGSPDNHAIHLANLLDRIRCEQAGYDVGSNPCMANVPPTSLKLVKSRSEANKVQYDDASILGLLFFYRIERPKG